MHSLLVSSSTAGFLLLLYVMLLIKAREDFVQSRFVYVLIFDAKSLFVLSYARALNLTNTGNQYRY